VTDDALDNLLHEDRRFTPPADLAANANVTAEMYAEAEADFEGFWAKQAKRLSWQTEPTQVLDWSNPPFAKWYADGTLNAAYNCLDRHVEAGNGDRVAFYFEGEPGDTQVITYAELTRQDRRSGSDLPPDDSRSSSGDAGMCPDRRTAHGGFRRLLLRCALLPRDRLRRQVCDHCRWRLPPRQCLAIEAGSR
jgi:hypothetical protein